MLRESLEYAVESGKQIYRLEGGRVPRYVPIAVGRKSDDGLCYWTSDNGWSYWDAEVYIEK